MRTIFGQGVGVQGSIKNQIITLLKKMRFCILPKDIILINENHALDNIKSVKTTPNSKIRLNF